MRYKPMWAALAALALSGGNAMADDSARAIRVTGEGKATAAPDMATIQTGVVSEAGSAKEALAANNKAMESVLELLKSKQVASKDVKTSQFNVQPVYRHDERGRTVPEVVSYRVSNQVRINVRDIAKIGEVLDALVQAGSNQMSGINFGLTDPTKTLDEARMKAVADARRRAELYAKAAGVRVGKVLSISEQSVLPPQPRFETMRLGAAAASVPVASGEEELHVTVHMAFALEDDK